jgi:hypothetical protein
MVGRLCATAALVWLTLGLGAADAHHSVAGTFDNAKRVRLTGTISRIEWSNPHTSIYLDVTDEHGSVATWRLESLPATMLKNMGLTSELLMAGGATVSADALLARGDAERLAWALKLTYEDGHFYQLAGE